MASATKGLAVSFIQSFQSDLVEFEASMPVPSPASMQDLQQPLMISSIPLRRLPTSPFRSESKPGMSPGFLTMNAMSSDGSPLMLKNSRPFSSTNFWKTG